MAKAAGVELTIDRFQELADTTPFLADMKPSGQFVMEDLYQYGGVPALMKTMLELGKLHGDELTSHRQNRRGEPGERETVVEGSANRARLNNPIKPTATSRFCMATSPPKARSPRSPARKVSSLAGPARVFDSEELTLRAHEQGKIKAGDVVVIRLRRSARWAGHA